MALFRLARHARALCAGAARRTFVRATLRATLRATASALIGTAALLPTAWAKPITVTDVLGRQVQVESPARRVVLGFHFEEFTAIAGAPAWSRVVGISRTGWAGWRAGNWARYTEVIPGLKDLPDVGFTDDSSFSAEKVIALRPDVLILPEWGWNALGPAAAQLQAAGVPVVVVDYNAQTLERHLASTRLIGSVMGATARAETLARLYQAKVDDVMARIARAPKTAAPKVYVELGRDGAGTIGNSYQGTMWGRMVTTVGGQNLADRHLKSPWGPLNPEVVLAENPDHVLIAGSSWANRPQAVRLGYASDDATARATLRPYAERAGWPGLTAVRRQQVFTIDHGLCRTLTDYTALQFIAKQLYPAQFADVDPAAELRRYHEQFLPVAYGGTWFLSLKP
ncbi:ABC transporter substrate-binding protein [Pseudaquabacterium rugosum]|uniref:ABC transporter substrate-binding protein n=1 Tax=Pseudaquabacterium rugosum TaxID=2984194 RepID=A0ABU9BH89_9BURK